MFFSKGSVVQILLRYMASSLKYMANGKPWELFLQFCLSNSAAMLSSSFHEVNFQKRTAGNTASLLLSVYTSEVSASLNKSPLYKTLQVSTSLKTVQVSASQESISLRTSDISPPRKLLAEPATASLHANLRENREYSMPDLILQKTEKIVRQI